MPRLEVSGLVKRWKDGQKGRSIAAVDDVSFELAPGEVLGLVGESGCGKSTLARLLLGLLRADEGSILWEGRMQESWSRRARASMVQMIFQDPSSSLHPRRDIRWQLREPLRYVRRLEGRALDREIEDLLAAVQLPPDCLERFPHELSGGQKQRIAIARALALQPAVLVADEALSALDRLTQQGIMEVLRRWTDNGGALLLIAHDLSAVRQICDRVAVMYGGRLMELRVSSSLFEAPAHPYTRFLMQSMPRLYRSPDRAPQVESWSGLAPPIARESCAWAALCPLAVEQCQKERPLMRSLRDGTGSLACHRAGEWERGLE